MTVYLAFNETESLDNVSNLANVVPATTDVIIAGVNRGGIAMLAQASAVNYFTPLTEGWLHVMVKPMTSGFSDISDYLAAVRAPSGLPLFGLYNDVSKAGEGDVYAKWHGSATTYYIGDNAAAKWDLHWKLDAVAGHFRIYKYGSLVFEFVGDTLSAGVTTADNIRLRAVGYTSTSSAYATKFSQVLVSDTPTIGALVYTLPLTAFGTTNNWTGDLTNVNGTDQNDATVLSEDVDAGEVLFTKGTLPALFVGFSITGLVFSARALAQIGSVPQNLTARALISGTTYSGATKALTAAFKPVPFVFGVNPATALPWTVAEINAAEIGVRADA